jgi:8-oxo-dGTP pyrophosphatase MutT (NUDIX family)
MDSNHDVEAAARPSHFLSPEEMSAALRRPRPGLSAQLEMSPLPRPGTVAHPDNPPDAVAAAVLILIYPKDRASHIVFIRRPSSSVHHKGQIAFPGGRIEGSESPVEAALREAKEEVGVPPAQVAVAGILTPLYIPPSRYCVTPVIGLAAAAPAFVPFPGEVAEILEVPLAHLLDPAAVRREMWRLDRGDVSVPFYAFGEHKIWGATAMILSELLAVLRSAG